jgi:hypothetical protein
MVLEVGVLVGEVRGRLRYEDLETVTVNCLLKTSICKSFCTGPG